MPEPESVQIRANGFTFSALASGPIDGRPVLLLHGFPQTSHCFSSEVAALGAAGFRAVAPDQRGYSAGARPSETEAYRTDHLVADVVAMADALSLSTFDLVGHDWGGMVAWLVAAAHPDRVRTLTSVSTPHPTALASVLMSGDEDQLRRSAYIQWFRQPGAAEASLLGDDGLGDGLRAMFAAAGLEASLAEPYVTAMSEPGRLHAALEWYRAGDPSSLLPQGPIAVPTLYVWSTEDAALGRRAAEETADHVDGPYRFEVLDGVSHWIPDEAPEQLHRLLMDHLSSRS